MLCRLPAIYRHEKTFAERGRTAGLKQSITRGKGARCQENEKTLSPSLRHRSARRVAYRRGWLMFSECSSVFPGSFGERSVWMRRTRDRGCSCRDELNLPPFVLAVPRNRCRLEVYQLHRRLPRLTYPRWIPQSMQQRLALKISGKKLRCARQPIRERKPPQCAGAWNSSFPS